MADLLDHSAHIGGIYEFRTLTRSPEPETSQGRTLPLVPTDRTPQLSEAQHPAALLTHS